jgi:uncharacterized phage protein (TIGR01671 family)
MREIKFRVWEKKEKQFVDFGSAHAHYGLGGEFKHPNLVFQQFTGLKDKNKEEIYEGDIIQTNTFGNKVIGVIEYVKDSFVITGRYMNKKNSVLSHFDCYGNMNVLEVIGNVFENPELIS